MAQAWSENQQGALIHYDSLGNMTNNLGAFHGTDCSLYHFQRDWDLGTQN